MAKKILVPIDGSEHSVKTLEHAITMGKDLDGELTVLQVIDTPFFTGYPYDLTSVHQDLEKITDNDWERVEPTLKESGISYKRAVEKGSPAEIIIAAAEQGHFDLLIIGSHGAGAAERFLLGSVSDRVVHHAPCDIFVVK